MSGLDRVASSLRWFIVLNCSPAIVPAQATQGPPRGRVISVGPNVHVSERFGDANHHEVVLAAHPSGSILLACSMVGDAPERAVNSVAYLSRDGGTSWSLASVSDEHFADDPTCAFGPDGSAYFVTKTNTGVGMVPGASSDTDSLHIRRSRDGGVRWDPVVHSLHANDRPFIAIDTTRGVGRGTFYVVFDDHLHAESGRHGNEDFRHALVLAASPDRGDSFPRASVRALLDQSKDTVAASLAAGLGVLSNGTVVVLQHHMLLGGGNAATGKLREVGGWLQTFRSSDGGRTLSAASRITAVTTGYNSPWSRGVTGSLAVDPGSASFRDRLYVVWTDFSTGRGVIRLVWSRNGGDTWSAPAAIGEDRASGEANAAPDNFMPTVAVNSDGVVGVMWYDRRRRAGTSAYDVRFTASLDGGESWLPSVEVSALPNDERQQRQRDAGHPVNSGSEWRPAPGTFSPTGGDTAGLAADAGGRFHALWIDNRTGLQQVWTSTISISAP